jgi:hypothetical protein
LQNIDIAPSFRSCRNGRASSHCDLLSITKKAVMATAVATGHIGYRQAQAC